MTTPSRLHPLVILLAGFLLAGATLGAQQPPLEDEAVLFQDLASAYDSSKGEEEVSAASKRPEAAAAAPATVTVVTAEEIEVYGYRTLGDILQSVPGLYVNNDRNYSYLGVRGFGRPGDYNSRVLLLVDGRRLNDAVFDTAAIGAEFPIDVDLIERVEIIRGPGSALYGSSALFAVINVLTRSARQVDGLELSTSWESHDTTKGRLTYGGRSASGVETLVSASGYRSLGQDLYFSEFDLGDGPGSGPGGDGMARGLDGDDGASMLAKVAWHDLSFELFHGSREKHFPTAAFGTVFGDRRARTNDDQGAAELAWGGGLGPVWDLKATLFYDWYDYDGFYPYDWAEEGDEPNVVVYADWARSERWGSEVQFDRSFSDRHHLTFGAELRDNLRQDQGAYDVGVGDVFAIRETSREWGLFAQDELALGRKVTLIAGARWDQFQGSSDINPRLAVLIQPRAGSHLKLLAGRAFRTPNAYELFYFTDGAAEDLVPETVETFEVSFGQELRPGLEASLSAYQIETDRLITLVTDAGGELAFANADSARTVGFELGLEGRLAGALRGRLAYALQHSEGSDGSTLTNSPEHLAKLNLWTPLFDGRLRLGTDVQHIAKRRTIVGDGIGSATVANLNLVLPRLPLGLRMSAGIYNVFDHAYGDPGSEEHVQQAIPQDGRNFRLKLGLGF